jgi:cell division septal protein FtsQ
MRESSTRRRSEAVRHRRKQAATKRLSDSTVLATRPLTPITSRTSAMPAAPHQKERRAARHRSDAAVSMPGVEIRLPAVSFSGPGAKWRFVSFGISLLLGAAMYMAGTSELFRAGAAQVTGNQRIRADEIGAVLGIGNSQVFTLIPSELERRLRLNFPDILAARVTIGLPNQVYVEVTERTPIVVWNQGSAYTWIDDSGVAFRPRGTAEHVISVQAEQAPSPAITSAGDPLSPLPFISPDLVATIKVLAPYAPSGASLIYDQRLGLGWQDNRGWQAFFGDQARDLSLRLRVYDSMVAMMAAKGIRPEFISVQYPSGPYYRMAQ